MVGVGGLSLPSKLLSAPGDRGTLRGAAGKERAEPRPPRPRTGSEPGADRPGREEGRAGGEVHRGGRDRPGGRGVPAATRAGLALPCPCGSPGWVTRWGCMARGCRGAPWDTHTHTPQPPAGSGAGQRSPAGAGRAAGSPAAAGSSCHRLCPSHPTSGQAHTELAADALCRRARPATASPPPSWQHGGRKAQLPAAPDSAALARLGLRQSRAGCEHPAGFSKCKGPHTPTRERRCAPGLPCSLLKPPMALVPGLPGAALGSPPSGCQGPGALLTLSGGQG